MIWTVSMKRGPLPRVVRHNDTEEGAQRRADSLASLHNVPPEKVTTDYKYRVIDIDASEYYS